MLSYFDTFLLLVITIVCVLDYYDIYFKVYKPRKRYGKKTRKKAASSH